jgi:GGDEF domain-containing protein
MRFYEIPERTRAEAGDAGKVAREQVRPETDFEEKTDIGTLLIGRYAPSPSVFSDYGDRVRDFQGIPEMLASGCGAFFLDTPDDADALAAVESIRRNPPTSYSPVFSSSPHGQRFEALIDGVFDHIGEVRAKSEKMLSALREVNMDMLAKSSDFRLMAWFYLRRGVELTLLANPKTDDIYGYPVAECIADSGVDHRRWLDGLRARGQIAQTRLVDRVRVCPKCSSPHLNFIDVCPNCKSINIAKKELIHCFTCGRVGVADTFIRDNSMVCPFCRAVLRHIGSDYDHPLESIVCEDCAECSTDSYVLAVCRNCGSRNVADELGVRSYFTYTLTEKGRTAARVGQMENAYALFDRLGAMGYALFEQMLDWNINMLKRYPDDNPFTVIALRFDNIEEIGDAVGDARTAQMIDALTVRLKNIIRTTDMVMRSSMDTLCFFLPHTDKEQSRIVTGRMEALRDDVILKDAPRLGISIRTRTLPEDPKTVCAEGNAKMLLMGMTANI